MNSLRYFFTRSACLKKRIKRFAMLDLHTAVNNMAASRASSSTTNMLQPIRFTPRRSLLYVPGNDERKILKIPKLNADCVVMDCEDGVAINKKAEARQMICKMLDQLPRGQNECSVRINSPDSELADEDIKTIFEANNRPDSIVIPKVESTEQVDWIIEHLNRVTTTSSSSRHDSHDWINLIIQIESARALLDMDKICSHFQRRLHNNHTFHLDAVIFGSDDFCASIGATRTKDATEVLYARQHFVIVAKAHHLQAIDMVYIDYKDLEGLHMQCIQGSQMGFTGKQVIHPDQIAVAQKAFAPSKDRIEWATSLINAFEEHQKSGKGAFNFRGSMIDMPSVRQAKNVIQLTATAKDQKHQ